MITIEHSLATVGRNFAQVDDPDGELKSFDDYFYAIGFIPPNYPMPVTLRNADIAIMHLSLSACRYSNDGPCCICIDKWLEELDYNFGYEE